MAKRVTRPAESWSYVLQSDRGLPLEEQSRFVLSPLSQIERAAIRDEIARVSTASDGRKDIISRERRQGVEIVLDHLVSVENFPAGAPQKWPDKREERSAYLEQLDDDFVQELANEIWEKSTIGLEVKNS